MEKDRDQKYGELESMALWCKTASRAVANLDSAKKNQALLAVARGLVDQAPAILAANQLDLEQARESGLSEAMIDRLKLDQERIHAIAQSVQAVAALPDPVGQVSSMWLRPNGINVGKRRIPLGVIAMIYESRPNVTVDAAVLCFKAGNGVILKGGSDASMSNCALATVIRGVFGEQGIPKDAVVLLQETDRSVVRKLLSYDHIIDLVIPRGGEGLIRFVDQVSRIPVIKHYKGVCHLYVDQHADPTLALNLLIDGKTSRPGVCNALETLLIHRDIAEEFLKLAGPVLKGRGVQLRGCSQTRELIPGTTAATEADYHAEYLDLILAVKVVDDFEAALEHIQIYGSDHTEVIATENYQAAQQFSRRVNASVVMVNASPRFSDGGELGLGAEIGISTTKLHAFGPMGLTALTTEKFIVFGNGQVRHPETLGIQS